MKKVLFALAALLFVGAASAQELEKAQEKYEAAGAKLQAKDFAAAIPLFKEAMSIAIDAGDAGLEMAKDIQGRLPKLYFAVGMSQAQDKKFDEAIKTLTEASEMADLYNDVTTARQASRVISGLYMAKGAESFNNKDFAAALEIFEKGYKQDPSNIKLANFTAKTYAELGRLTEAVELFNKVIETGASNSRYAEDAAEAQKDASNAVLVAVAAAVEAGDLDKAISVADLLPTNAAAAMLVIQAANNTKKYDVVIARGDATATLQTDPALQSDVYYFVGSAYNARENKPKAIEYLSKVSAGQFAAQAKAAVTELRK